MYSIMVEKFSLNKQINSLKQLGESRMIDNTDIEESVVWNSIWSLTIAKSIANTNSHNTALNLLTVYLNVHLVIKTLEDKEYE